MTVEENQASVVEEVATPTETEQQDVQQEEVQAPPSHVMSDKEYNWNEARRKMQDLERRAAEQEETIRRMQQSQVPIEEDDLAKLADDDIVTAKQARSLAVKMAREVADEAIRERESATAGDRLKVKYPDYDDVVTRDNLELLQTQDPELAMSVQALAHDPYAQAVAAYKMLKRTGIGDMVKQHPSKARAIENTKKPVSVQSVTKTSAIGNVHNFENGLTPELRKSLQKEMADAIKRG